VPTRYRSFRTTPIYLGMPFARLRGVIRRSSPLRSTSRRQRLHAVGVLCIMVLGLIGTTKSPVAASAPSPLALSAIRDVNYMPSNASGANMWIDWNPEQIASDYATIAALGANTVRVIVPAPAMGYPYANALQAHHLATIFTLAAAAGLHVQLTLFDQFGLYTEISSSISFIQALMAPYGNDPELAFVELQNEINPFNATAMTWASALIPALQAKMGTVPVTISTEGSHGPAGLAQLKSALAKTPPDFYDYHFYGSAGAAYSQLSQAQADAAPSRLFVGEAGVSTAGSKTAFSTLSRLRSSSPSTVRLRH
jgi:hypothetical protein